MKIKLPKSGGEYLEAITACGRIDAKHLSKSTQKDVRLYAQSKAGGVGVIVSRAEDEDVHFHLDVFGRSYLKGSKRKASAKPSEVEEVFKSFVGKPIGVVVTGKFSVPLNEANDESITQLLLSVSVGQAAEGRLVGALYEVDEEDEDVTSVQWQKSGDGDSAILRVVIESVSETVIHADYLERLAAPLESALRTMVLE